MDMDSGEGMAGMNDAPGSTTAVYLIIKNGATADRLTAAKSDVAKAVEIHQTSIENGMARMSPVDAIDIPASGTVELKPGGYHIMLVEPTRALNPGDTFPIALVFDRAGEVSVTVTVQKAV
jgi:copper(I)-binding protein